MTKSKQLKEIHTAFEIYIEEYFLNCLSDNDDDENIIDQLSNAVIIVLQRSSLKNKEQLIDLFKKDPCKFQKYLEDAVYTFQWEDEC